jgi:hypothetical protein
VDPAPAKAATRAIFVVGTETQRSKAVESALGEAPLLLSLCLCASVPLW